MANQNGLKIKDGWGVGSPPRWREEGTSCVDPAVSTMVLGTRAPVCSFPPHTGPDAARWQDLSLRFPLQQGQSSWVTSIDCRSVGWRNGRHCRFLSSCHTPGPTLSEGAGHAILTCAAPMISQERPRFGFWVSCLVFPFSFSMFVTFWSMLCSRTRARDHVFEGHSKVKSLGHVS